MQAKRARAQASRRTIIISGEVDRDQRTCRVIVSDNGPGIREANRVKVFQPFFTTRAHGTGLGLAIVQKVVVTHGGRIAAGSSPLGGASFEMTFPAADDEPHRQGSSARRPSR